MIAEPKTEGVLSVLDESPASKSTIQYVGRFPERSRDSLASTRASAEFVLNEAATYFRKAGVTSRSIGREFSHPTEPREAARLIVEQAQARKCCTVVIGPNAHSWFRTIASGDIAERVLQDASDISPGLYSSRKESHG